MGRGDRGGRAVAAILSAFLVFGRAAAPGARGDSGEPTLEDLARQVLAAVESGDGEALSLLAARRRPDAWLVADALLAGGRNDAAASFARAVRGAGGQGLPKYVDAQRGRTADAALRRIAEQAEEALARRDATATLAMLPPIAPPDESGVPGVRLREARFVALRLLERHREAREAAALALESARRIGWTAAAARALLATAQSSQRLGEFDGARAAYEESLRLWSDLEDRGRALAIRASLGALLLDQGRAADAIPLLRQAFEEIHAAGDRSAAGTVLGNLAAAHVLLGKYEEALAQYREARGLFEEANNLPGAAGLAAQEADVLANLGRFGEAEQALERARAGHLHLGDEHGLAIVQVNLAVLRARQGRHRETIALLERARPTFEGRGERVALLPIWNALGASHLAIGEWIEAQAAHERVLALARDLKDAHAVAMALTNLAQVHQFRGAYARALATYEEGRALALASGNHAAAAAALSNIGIVYHELRDNERSLAVLKEALDEHRALKDRAAVTRVLGNIAVTLGALGRDEEALEVQREVLAGKKDIGDEAGAASTLGSIGDTLVALGRVEEGKDALTRSRAEHLRLGNRRHAIETLTSLARIEALRGGDPTATYEAALREAQDTGAIDLQVGLHERIARQQLSAADFDGVLAHASEGVTLLSTMSVGLGDEQGGSLREGHVSLYELGAIASSVKQDPDGAAAFLEAGRAGSLLEALGGRDRLRRALLPSDILMEEIAAREDERAAREAQRLAQQGGERAALREARQALAAAAERGRAILERIQREAKRQAAVAYPVPVPLARMRERLADDEALVLYGASRAGWTAVVATRGAARVIPIGMPEDLEAVCHDGSWERPDRDGSAALASLRERLIDVLDLPAGVRRLIVSPDGPIAYAPLAAAATHHEVVFVPSGSTWVALREERAPRGTDVLALGDPDYAQKGAAPDAVLLRGGERLQPLPATRVEARSVGTRVLLGADASEDGLASALASHPERWRAVHFACHGLVDPDRPGQCHLALSADPRHDGFLTADEILRMQVPADLAVLSACETAKGRIVRGEGVYGLTRSFMYAGVPRVICSLWKVDDEATLELATKFYSLWSPRDGTEPLGAATALRAAQAHVRDQPKWKHPAYWAAWVLWGPST